MMELDLKIMGGDGVGFIVMGTCWFLYFIYLKLFKKQDKLFRRQDSSSGSGESHGESSQENTSSIVDQLTEMIRSGQREEAIELFQSAAEISREEAIRQIDELEQLC
ncbi:MAG: hypothetical protein VB912_08350 [Pirellulaceae bacterium]